MTVSHNHIITHAQISFKENVPLSSHKRKSHKEEEKKEKDQMIIQCPYPCLQASFNCTPHLTILPSIFLQHYALQQKVADD